MRNSILLILLLVGLTPINYVVAQQIDEDCLAYISDLNSDITQQTVRMESWVYRPSALVSDFTAWVELRWKWSDHEVPDCAIPIHANVVSMFASLSDAAGFAANMNLSNGASRLQRFRESVWP